MSTDRTYHWGVLTGMVVGALFLLAGFTLCILGVTGTIQFFLEAGGTKARLLNASPGVFFAFLGTIIMWKYKPNIQENKTEEKKVERRRDNNGGFTTVIHHTTHQTVGRSEMRTGGR